MMLPKRVVFVVAAVLVARSGVRAAELSVSDVAMEPGTTAAVVVFGTITDEATFGVTIVVEITPRLTTTGTVQFTPAPPVDIVQAGDPWTGRGLFSAFDTDRVPTPMFNASVDDNGTFLPERVTYSGALTSFPIVASVDADGIWDVKLSSHVKESNWEGVPTTLIAGTITVVEVPVPLVAVLDIKPETCPNRLNVRSRRVIPMIIVGSETFDVAEVDVHSLWLSRADGTLGALDPITRRSGRVGFVKDATAPSDDADPCACHDRVRDGIDDLIVKFSARDMVRAFSLATEPRGAAVPLALSGYLLDGTPFEASVCVVLTGRGNASSERGLGGPKRR
jgi:hypothetical protein